MDVRIIAEEGCFCAGFPASIRRKLEAMRIQSQQDLEQSKDMFFSVFFSHKVMCLLLLFVSLIETETNIRICIHTYKYSLYFPS